MSLFDDDGQSHWDDPWTSREAAASVLRGPQRIAVLRALKDAADFGHTDSELGDVCHIRETAAGTRRKELEELGLCRRTERTRPTHYGNPAIVHVITERGLAALRVLERPAA